MSCKKNILVGVKLDAELAGLIDRERRKRSDLPGRSEIIRECILAHLR